MDKPDTIGGRIRKLRKERGMDQADLAAAIGVARANVSCWETGRYGPDRVKATKLARLFGVTLDYLQSGAEPLRDQVPVDAVHDLLEASILLMWRLLNETQKQSVLAFVSDLVAAPAAVDPVAAHAPSKPASNVQTLKDTKHLPKRR